MERKMISIDTLQKLLKPGEMKNILGGSGCWKIICDDGDMFYSAEGCGYAEEFWCEGVGVKDCGPC